MPGDSLQNFKLVNAYDSHVHWQATGAFSTRLDLSALKSSDISKLKPEKRQYRSEWLLGFGWDENLWKEKTLAFKNK